MAAKRRRAKKQQVTISVDPKTLKKLWRAFESLEALALGIMIRSHDVKLRAEFKKKRAKRRK